MSLVNFHGISTGIAAFDGLHREFIGRLKYLPVASDEEFVCRFGQLVAKMEETFAREEEWMEEIEFPARHSHLEQHARVLAAMHKVHSSVMAGNFEVGRQVVQELLPKWFALHVATMDAVLAIFMEAAMARQAGRLYVDGVSPMTGWNLWSRLHGYI